MLGPCTANSYLREEGGDVAFFSGAVDEAAGGEGCRVEGAEAGAGDCESEEDGAEGSEDGGAEGDGDGVGGVDYAVREDEDVGEVGEEVGCYY